MNARLNKKQQVKNVILNKSLQGVGSPIDQSYNYHLVNTTAEYSSFHPNSYIRHSNDQLSPITNRKKS